MNRSKKKKLREKKDRSLCTFELDGFIGGENVEFHNGLNSLRFVFDYRGTNSVKIVFKEKGKKGHLVVPMFLFHEVAEYLPPKLTDIYEDHN